MIADTKAQLSDFQLGKKLFLFMSDEILKIVNQKINDAKIFKASALWADAFYKSKCPSFRVSVRPSVRLCVCSLLRYRLAVFLPPLPEVGCPIFLEIRIPLGKVMERSGLRYKHFCLKIVYNCRAKESFFLHFFRSSSVFGFF